MLGLPDRARQPLPGDPVRTLDAIHLASLLVARSAVGGLRLLSLDERVRQAAKALGVDVVPTNIMGTDLFSGQSFERFEVNEPVPLSYEHRAAILTALRSMMGEIGNGQTAATRPSLPP